MRDSADGGLLSRLGLSRLFAGPEPEPQEEVDLPAAFKLAMRRNASAVAIITTANGRRAAGLTVISMVSLSTDPPALLFTINRSASAYEPLMASRRFAVNILGERQRHIAELFADPKRRAKRFEDSAWSQSLGGPPVLEGAGAAWVDCDLEAAHDFHSHTIVIGRVRRAWAGAERPLIYEDGAYGRVAPIETD
ncbi:MAG: flavin reductase family protein [Pseudomonadota bacterium]